MVMTAIMVAMFGMIMPAPLHMPPTVKVTPGYPMPSPEKLTEPCLGQVSVVMMARAAVSALGCAAGEIVGHFRHGRKRCRHTLREGLKAQVLADNARGGHEHLVGRAAHGLADELGGLAGVFQTDLARGGVRDAGVDDNGPGASVGGSSGAPFVQVLAGHAHGRRAEHIGREGGRRRTGLVGHDERHVETLQGRP